MTTSLISGPILKIDVPKKVDVPDKFLSVLTPYRVVHLGRGLSQPCHPRAPCPLVPPLRLRVGMLSSKQIGGSDLTQVVKPGRDLGKDLGDVGIFLG